MRTKLIAIAAIAAVSLAGTASASDLQHCKKPLVTRLASIALTKQPTLVQGQPALKKPL